LPKKVAVIGGGYIGVELAGVLNALGSEVEIFGRADTLLRGFALVRLNASIF
jgi:glutathione reductase (NADPH)